ncbi:MAG: hypothetical protein KDC61_00585 [Saprospiraceae bacterium]|nr:hypothetical protein [Saprospiraceae bacterium]
MKYLFCAALLLFLFANAAFSQETDSMKYYVNRFTDRTLSEKEHKEAGRKIRDLQKERYFRSKSELAGDTLLPGLERRIAAGFQQIDAATEQLIAIVSNTDLSNAVRWKALYTVSQVNTYMADSFLIANIDRFNYLGEHPGTAGGEIDWMYPCFGLLSGKAALNYALVKPILGNLNVSKTEPELSFIKMLLLSIFGKEESVRLWEDLMLANAENFVISKNLESLREIKK